MLIRVSGTVWAWVTVVAMLVRREEWLRKGRGWSPLASYTLRITDLATDCITRLPVKVVDGHPRQGAAGFVGICCLSVCLSVCWDLSLVRVGLSV